MSANSQGVQAIWSRLQKDPAITQDEIMKCNKLAEKLGFTPVISHTERLACGGRDKLTLEILTMQGLSRLFRIYPVSKILLMLSCSALKFNKIRTLKTKIKHNSIQYTAMSPFVKLTYAQSQLHIFRTFRKKLVLYLDQANKYCTMHFVFHVSPP